MGRSLAEIWIWFADTSCAGYSPLYERICRAVARSPEVLGLVESAPPAARLPNVLLASVHDMILAGKAAGSALEAHFRGDPDAAGDPGALFVEFCLAHAEPLGELLATRHTNTNEVGRSALLGPLLSEAGRQWGVPLALVDVGCSAGLNLHCDDYLLDYGAAGCTGPGDAALRIRCTVEGHPPIPPLLPPIAFRIGLDRDPVDLSDDREARWQLALTWPDTGRMERTRAAIDTVRHRPVEIVSGDAVGSLPDVMSRVPPGLHPVVVTTWSHVYLPVEARAAFREALCDIGRRRPVTWIMAEGQGVVPWFADASPPSRPGTEASILGLARFDGGAVEAVLAGFAHPHGWWLDWRLP